jgi:hypothetical protein
MATKARRRADLPGGVVPGRQLCAERGQRRRKLLEALGRHRVEGLEDSVLVSFETRSWASRRATSYRAVMHVSANSDANGASSRMRDAADQARGRCKDLRVGKRHSYAARLRLAWPPRTPLGARSLVEEEERGQRYQCSREGLEGRSEAATANSCHVPGTPLSAYSPRSTNSMPEPATRSRTVREMSTSPDSASAEMRAPVATAIPAIFAPTISHSPVWTPARTASPAHERRPRFAARKRLRAPDRRSGRRIRHPTVNLDSSVERELTTNTTMVRLQQLTPLPVSQ